MTLPGLSCPGAPVPVLNLLPGAVRQCWQGGLGDHRPLPGPVQGMAWRLATSLVASRSWFLSGSCSILHKTACETEGFSLLWNGHGQHEHLLQGQHLYVGW